MLEGYECGHYKLKINDHDDTLRIKLHVSQDQGDRPMGVFSSCRFVDSQTGLVVFAPFTPHVSRPRNQIASVLHRFSRKMPDFDGDEVEKFKQYARCVITSLKPVDWDDVPTTGNWLEGTSYGPGRKLTLAMLRAAKILLDDDIIKNKSFVKLEAYIMPKFARAINSYTDLSKAIMGPICKAIDKATYRQVKHFVKGTNPASWPTLLRDTFGGESVMETDFSSFEAHHRGVLAWCGWFWMMHMCRNVASPAFKRLISRLVLGTNTCVFKHITAEVDQRLMSGALWTSSMNGMLNFLLLSYLNGRTVFPDASPEWLAANRDEFFTGFVEGDDGLCINRNVDPSLIKRLGLDLKFKTSAHYGDASFCGIVCDPVEMKLVSDPTKIMRNFPVCDPKYALSSDSTIKRLMRAKALSYSVNLMECPVIGPLCYAVCKATSGYQPLEEMSETHSWKAASIDEALQCGNHLVEPTITESSRLLVEKHFGLTIESQLEIERAIRARPLGPYEITIHEGTSADFQHARDFTHPINAPWVAPPIVHSPPIVEQILKGGLKRAGRRATCKAAAAAYARKQPDVLLDHDCHAFILEHTVVNIEGAPGTTTTTN